MTTAMISSEYEVVIPPDIRKALDIKPGQQVQVIQYANRVELIPLRSIKSARGMLKGMPTDIEREADRL